MNASGFLTNLNLILAISASFVAIIAGIYTAIEAIIRRFRPKRRGQGGLTYNEKIKQLTDSLTSASSDVDRILQEMAQIVQERQKAVSTLEEKRTELQTYIESLEKGPAEPLKIFQEIIAEQARKQDQGGRKLAFRYFIYGAIVTLIGTGIGIFFTLPHPFGH